MQNRFPSHRLEHDGVIFSVGMEIPDDTDVLLVVSNASCSIPTSIPKECTIFAAGEPDEIRKNSAAFLNQFGLVLTPSDIELETRKLRQNYCLMWFAGVDFADTSKTVGYDYFASLPCPQKQDKISIVTSSKASTEYHKKRLKFIEVVKEKIPDHIEVFGNGFKSIDNKAEALLPYKYHLALENGGGDYSWSEKFSDPVLCWSFPFYHGCKNLSDDMPANSFMHIDIENPEEAIIKIMAAREAGIWEKRLDAIAEARQLLLTQYNMMFLYSRLIKDVFENHTAQNNGTSTSKIMHTQQHLIRSEKSLWPGTGSRANYLGFALRSIGLWINPKIEQKLQILKYDIHQKKNAWRRKRRNAKRETL